MVFKRKISILFFRILLICLILLSSCNSLEKTSNAEKINSENNNIPTFIDEEFYSKTIEPNLSETTALSEETLSTPIIENIPIISSEDLINKAEIEELNDRILDYLNKEGKYSDEYLSKLPHKGFDRFNKLEGNYFGVMRIIILKNNENTTVFFDNYDWEGSMVSIKFQAIYLGGTILEEDVILFMGMIDKAGNRIVIPIGLPILINDDGTLVKHLGGGFYDGGALDIKSTANSLIPSELSDFDRWNRYIDMVAVFDCFVTPLLDFYSEIIREFMKENSAKILEAYDETIPICRGLYNLVPDVRGGNKELSDYSYDFLILTKENFSNINERLEVEKPYIFYELINFVRP